MKDRSYYEIALTNRQVMTIFVVLLFCLLVAFLSGVWVGREGASPPVEAVTAEDSSAEAASAESPFEDLNFFSRAESNEGDGDDSPVVTRDTAAPAETAAGEYAQPIIIEESPPTRGEDRGVPRPTEEAETQTPTIGADEAPRGLVVQVLATADRAQADRVYQQLRDGGFSPTMSAVEVAGGPMFRVRLGPYSDRAEAQSVADRVRRAFRLDTWITR